MASTPRQSLGTHGQANLFPFPDVAALAPALRAYVINCQNAGIQRHGSFKVAVSGGSLPKTLAQALLAPASGEADTVKWDKWEIFFADERVVPLDHADSNYALLKAELLDKLPANGPKPNVYPINKDKLNEEALEVADDYEQLLVSSFASRDSVRLPIFDLLLLGCGPDGHTCSLFPGHELLREATAWVAPIEDSPKPPPKRITLTLPVVTHAVRIAFVATGGGKKGIMKQIFEEGAASGLPCALVNENTGDRCSWFVDDAAIEGVGYPKRSRGKSAYDFAFAFTGRENERSPHATRARFRSLSLNGDAF
ncbi:suppressor of los1-1 [Gnomoniopsis sp. IMI 355080]|nr:suppressor of los1-1 [Gnomoniopsis sp. IMI 355080]